MKLFLLLPFICCYSIAHARCRSGVSSGTFNVLHYGARANGFSDDSKVAPLCFGRSCINHSVSHQMLYDLFFFFFLVFNRFVPCLPVSVTMQAFMAAWKAACAASGNVKLHIPRRKYLVGPVKFDGPCRNVHSITVYMQVEVHPMTGIVNEIRLPVDLIWCAATGVLEGLHRPEQVCRR